MKRKVLALFLATTLSLSSVTALAASENIVPDDEIVNIESGVGFASTDVNPASVTDGEAALLTESGTSVKEGEAALLTEGEVAPLTEGEEADTGKTDVEAVGDNTTDGDEALKGEDTTNLDNVIPEEEEPTEPEVVEIVLKNAGWNLVDGNWFYGKDDLKPATGWIKSNGTWYYLDGTNATLPGVMLKNTTKVIDGSSYNFSESGAMEIGWDLKDDRWFYLGGSGAALTGWQYIGSNWFYLDGADEKYPGAMYASCSKEIEGKIYSFDGAGHMLYDWVLENGTWYYHTGSGARAFGWVYAGSNWFYLDGANEEKPGAMYASCSKEIEGKTYAFDSAGHMLYDWVLEGGTWYYHTGSGARATGWVYAGSNWFYLDGANEEKPGAMYASCSKEIEGKIYSFDSAGHMLYDWVLEDGTWYYHTGSGARAFGWVYAGSNWFYLDGANEEKPGAMYANTEKVIDDKIYVFDGAGHMVTGWTLLDGNWYYHTGSGNRTTGWIYSSYTWYYLDGTNEEHPGAMIKSTSKDIDGKKYYFDESGAMVTGWYKDGEDWYYINSSGYFLTGWQSVNGIWYYMYEDGKMAHDTTVDGYELSSSGAMIDPAGRNMKEYINGYSSESNYLIAVDRSSFNVGIFTGSQGNWNNIFFWPCVVGAPSTPTVTGEYTVRYKQYSFGHGYTCWYCTQILGDYLFHSGIYQQGSMTNGIDLGMSKANSQGCVRLELQNAKWMYDNIPYGTKIVIYN